MRPYPPEGTYCLDRGMGNEDRSEKCTNHVDDAVLRIEDRQSTPLVKCQAWMRYVKGDHVTNAQIILWGNLHVCVLIHHPCQDPLRCHRFGRDISWSVVQRRRRKPRIERRIPLTHCDNCLVLPWNRLHIRPDLERRQKASAHLGCNRIAAHDICLRLSIYTSVMRQVTARAQNNLDSSIGQMCIAEDICNHVVPCRASTGQQNGRAVKSVLER